MEKIAEQWKTEGDCSFCRRADYCSHECKAYKNHVAAIICSAIMEKTGFGEILDKSGIHIDY